MTKHEQVLDRVSSNTSKQFDKTVAHNISYDLIDMILLKNNDYILAIRLKRDYIVRKIISRHNITEETFVEIDDGVILLKYIYENKESNDYTINPYIMRSASETGNLGIIKYLYSIGIQPIYDTMDTASRFGCLDIIKFLHIIGIEPTHTTLERSVYDEDNPHLDIFTYLVKECNVMPKQCGMFDSLCNDDNIELIKWLYDNHCVKPTYLGIDLACGRGHLEMVKYLCGIGVEVTNASLHKAISSGNINLLKYLHEICGVKPNKANINMASEYRYNNYQEIIEYLNSLTSASKFWSGFLS
jgi:hypothetical protein